MLGIWCWLSCSCTVHLPLWPLQMAAAELLKRTAGLENSALRSVPPANAVFHYRNVGCPGGRHAAGGASQQADEQAEASVNTAKPGSQAVFCMSCMFVSGLSNSYFRCSRVSAGLVCPKAANVAASLHGLVSGDSAETLLETMPARLGEGGLRVC